MANRISLLTQKKSEEIESLTALRPSRTEEPLWSKYWIYFLALLSFEIARGTRSESKEPFSVVFFAGH